MPEREDFQPEFERSEEQKEKIQMLDQLSIGPAQKADVILVLMGLKPATELEIFKNNDPKEKIEEVLVSAGLKIKEKPAKKNVVARYVISLDDDILDRLMLAEPNKDHEEYGRLMGYPETAIKAFGTDEKISSDVLPDEDIIFNFTLSKNHKDEEIEVLRKWSRAIKENAPDLFNKLRKRGKNKS